MKKAIRRSKKAASCRRSKEQIKHKTSAVGNERRPIMRRPTLGIGKKKRSTSNLRPLNNTPDFFERNRYISEEESPEVMSVDDSEYDSSFIDDSERPATEIEDEHADDQTLDHNCVDNSANEVMSRGVAFERDVLDESENEEDEDLVNEVIDQGSSSQGVTDGAESNTDLDTADSVVLSLSNPFAEAREVQRNLLSRRRDESQSVRLSRDPRITREHYETNEGNPSIPEKWSVYLNGLFEVEPDFLTSDEAKMISSTALRQGITSYRRLVLNDANCEDVLEVFRLMFKAKAAQGFSNAGYSHFLTAVGQFARMRCAMEADECERELMLLEMCNEGNLFKLVASLDHVELFLDYFEARSSSSATCLGKSAQLLKLSTAARRFYERKGDSRTVANIERVIDKLHSCHSAYKQATRRQSRQKKSLEKRKAEGVMMLPKDFLSCRTTAVNKLTGLMSTIRRLKVQQSQQESDLRLMRDEALMSVWCINMLAVMMICCGGQRPQVFCQIQRPTGRDFNRFQSQSSDKCYIELHTVLEKTSRALDMPFVPFPSSLLGILRFHVEEILPVLDRKRENLARVHNREESFSAKCLLLHSKRGLRLSTKQVTDTLRLFLFNVNPKLAKMSTMNLRSSYATMMLHAHREGRIFKDEAEGTFLEFLGKAMNTSVEQLRDTYASVVNEDYSIIANAITNSLNKIVISEQDEDDPLNTPSSLDEPHCETVFPSDYDQIF